MRIAIIGGGAAGMMAAATAKKVFPKYEVVLIEQNPSLGRKVIISGGGRCNVTTGIQHIPKVLENYPRGKKFLYSAMTKFPPAEVQKWFESHGVKLKTESDLRVFPVSDDGKDVVKAFEKVYENLGVKIWTKAKVQKVAPEKNKFLTKINDRNETFDKLILTTGGQAYRHTGSTGDGYTFAESCGHTITPLGPSLNSFIVKDQWIRELAGVSLKNTEFKLVEKKKINFKGPFLFTHKGLTGPAIFAFSALTAHEKISQEFPLKVAIDFFPEKNQEELRQEIQNYFQENHKKLIKNLAGKFLPNSLELALMKHSEINTEKIAAELSKKDLNKYLHNLKFLELELIGRAAGDEFVTAGGVDLKEVDSKTMQSKITPGLFFGGEILDVDGFTGGFNLQASWATGYLAGSSLN